MITKLLATTALSVVITTGAMAQATAPAGQSTTAPAAASSDPAVPQMATSTAVKGEYLEKVGADQYLVSDLTGLDVYQSADSNADEAGEIDNFLIDGKGKVLAAIVDTGSFLDESKIVAVPIEKINFTVGQNNSSRAVLTASREELMAAPAFTPTTAAEAAEGGAMAPASGVGATAGSAMSPDPASTATATPAATGAAPLKPIVALTDKSGYIATVGEDQRLSEDIIGSDVYGGPGSDAVSIGNVNDLVISKSGDVAAAVIGVGGFLGIGEKNVGVPFAELSVAEDQNGGSRMILAATKEQLTAAPTFYSADEVAETSKTSNNASSMASTGAATGAAVGSAVGSAADATSVAANDAATSAGNAVDKAADGADQMAQSAKTGVTNASSDATTTASTGGATDRASMTPATGADLSAENITGTTVYGPNDENIGSVSDLALTADGKVDAIIVDVGGFLGIGQKSVAVTMDNLQFMKDSGGSLYLYTQFTQDQLKNAPEYNKDGYAENRNTMRITPDTKLPSSAPAGDAQAPTPAQ